MSSEMSFKVLGNVERGRSFVLSGPAGTGKTTLVTMLTEEFSCVKESVSYTTRHARPDEVPGLHYHFVEEEDFEEKIHAGEFLEYVRLFGHYYGTSKRWIEQQMDQGCHVILTIDTQGALKIKEEQLLQATFIFVSSPSLDELAERLRSRKTEGEEMIQTRLERAKKEMKLSSHYDYNIINDDLNIAYHVLRSILIAEEHKTCQGDKI